MDFSNIRCIQAYFNLLFEPIWYSWCPDNYTTIWPDTGQSLEHLFQKSSEAPLTFHCPKRPVKYPRPIAGILVVVSWNYKSLNSAKSCGGWPFAVWKIFWKSYQPSGKQQLTWSVVDSDMATAVHWPCSSPEIQWHWTSNLLTGKLRNSSIILFGSVGMLVPILWNKMEMKFNQLEKTRISLTKFQVHWAEEFKWTLFRFINHLMNRHAGINLTVIWELEHRRWDNPSQEHMKGSEWPRVKTNIPSLLMQVGAKSFAQTIELISSLYAIYLCTWKSSSIP